MGAVVSEDGLFVAFAEDEDDIARLCKVEGFFDGLLAVENDEEILVESFAGFFGAFNEHVGNFLRIFVAGIIFRNNNDITVLAKDFAAGFAGGMVTLAGAAMNGDDFRFVVLWFDTGEDFFESIGGMSIIDNNLKILTGLDASHAAFNRVEAGDTVGNLLIGKADEFTNTDGGKGIINIELTRDLGFDRENFILPMNIKIISHIMT